MIYNQNIIYMYMQQRRKTNQIIHGGQSCSVLPFVDRLRRIEPEGRLLEKFLFYTVQNRLLHTLL